MDATWAKFSNLQTLALALSDVGHNARVLKLLARQR